MTWYGPPYDGILIVEAIIWFILTGYVLYLVGKTKLTHVEKFRKRFALGIVLILVSFSTLIVTRDLLTLPEAMNSISQVVVVLILISAQIAFLSALFDLDKYIDSIINIGMKRRKLIVALCAIPPPIVFFLLSISADMEFLTFIVIAFTPFIYYIFYYICFFCVVIDREMISLKIRMMFYFAWGFGFATMAQFLQVQFLNLSEGLVLVLYDLFYLMMLVFLIVGYIDFKNRIKQIQENM